jgi:aspartate ammonia-lyase
MTQYRTEDLSGSTIPADALYGVHTVRSIENFPLSRRPVNPSLIHAFGAVKLACARTNHELGWWDYFKANAIEQACNEMMEGMLDGHILVDAGSLPNRMNRTANRLCRYWQPL